MSMPNFPEDVLDITCDQALNMILGSIAMEELALSHIMNAEGEKLQYVLGTLPGQPCGCATPKEILAVNRSISDLLEKVAYNQILLKGKLREVLDAKALCRPPEPPCPPMPQHICCVLHGKKGRVWSAPRPLQWTQPFERGCRLCCLGCSETAIYLCAQNALLVTFSIRARAEAGETVRVALRSVQGCACEDLAACETIAMSRESPVCLSGSAVLSPEHGKPFPAQIQFVLQSPCSVTLERATCHLTAL